ncbi:uncharacterized protein LOC112585204 isoform X1 [Bubalus bubalis]|uniref:uncharacterized protein LOC112585204 isoform X1 n=1 Tax=Bubalus bubalis TaxID=89462 RepID=UPI001E1B73E1|nr:uncharacterized protein LOC112585204 isoform X1 [Bubalus bubalis]
MSKCTKGRCFSSLVFFFSFPPGNTVFPITPWLACSPSSLARTESCFPFQTNRGQRQRGFQSSFRPLTVHRLELEGCLLPDEQQDCEPGRSKIVQWAEELVGQEFCYSLTSKNCEHFVNELRYGVSRSDQVRDALTAATISGVGLIALSAGVMFSRNKKQHQ